MAYEKKTVQEYIAETDDETVEGFNDNQETRIKAGFDKLSEDIKLTTSRFYERSYTTGSAGNINTTLPLSERNTVVVHNLINVDVSIGDKYKYSLDSYFINNSLYFRLFNDGVPVSGISFSVRFIVIEAINVV